MLALVTRTPARRWLCFAALTLVFLLALCTIPYHVPLRPSFSLTWAFGYNSRAGIAIVLLTACAAACFAGELRRTPAPGKPLTRSTLLKVLLLTLALAAAVHLLYGRYDGFMEGIYTVDRVKLILAGQRPYRDFSFAYGALCLYAPVALVHLFPLSVTSACDLFWSFVLFCGALELYFVLRWTEFSPATQRRVFLLLSALTLVSVLSMSTSYTLVRFLTPGFCAMALVSALGKASSPRRHAALLLWVGPCTALCLAISPEMGLVFVAGMLLFLLRFGRLRQGLQLAAFAGTLLLTSLVLVVAAHAGAFRMMHSVSVGGYNYPLTLAPHLLVLFAAIMLTATYVGGRLRAGQGTPLLALCFVSAAMLPAALSRCDLGHAWMDGIGIVLCASLLCASAARPASLFLLAALLVFAVLPVVKSLRGLANLCLDPVAAILLRPAEATAHPLAAKYVTSLLLHANHPAEGQTLLQTLPARQEQQETLDVPATFGYPSSTVFAAPFAFFAGHTGPFHSAAIDDGYFLGTVDMMGPDDVALKIAELARHPERPMLLQPGSENSCTRSAPAVLSEMRFIMSYPYSARLVHADDVLEPFCAYVRDHYHEQLPASAAQRGYAVWVRNPAP